MIYLLAVVAPLLASSGHIMVKHAAISEGALWGVNWRSMKILAGGALFMASAVVSVYCLRVLEFSAFYSLTALSYIFVAVLSRIFVRERFDLAKVLGSIFIVVGVYIYNRGA